MGCFDIVTTWNSLILLSSTTKGFSPFSHHFWNPLGIIRISLRTHILSKLQGDSADSWTILWDDQGFCWWHCCYCFVVLWHFVWCGLFLTFILFKLPTASNTLLPGNSFNSVNWCQMRKFLNTSLVSPLMSGLREGPVRSKLKNGCVSKLPVVKKSFPGAISL